VVSSIITLHIYPCNANCVNTNRTWYWGHSDSGRLEECCTSYYSNKM